MMLGRWIWEWVRWAGVEVEAGMDSDTDIGTNDSEEQPRTRLGSRLV
jgi:hypothetical protein